MNRFSLTRTTRLAAIEYRKWLFDARMVVAASMLLFIWMFALSPLLELSREMNSPLNFLEPFLAVLNSEPLGLVCPAVFLFLISDYPKVDAGSLFLIHRLKKSEWAVGQMLFFIYAILSFLGAIFVLSTISALVNAAVFSNTWSSAVTDYGLAFPDRRFSFAAQLLTNKLYNQLSPISAALSAFSLLGLYLLAFAMILLLFRVFSRHKVGIILSVFLIAFGSAAGYAKQTWMWVFPMPHTIISFHFTDYFRVPVFPLWGSYLYLSLLVVVLVVVVFLSIRRLKFAVDREE